MGVNFDKADQWVADIDRSVAQYNAWYETFAPEAYRQARRDTEKAVEEALRASSFLAKIPPEFLQARPELLFVLRMCTAPPLARDRLTGLSGVPKSLVDCLDRDGRVPPRMSRAQLRSSLERIGQVITTMTDPELFPWIRESRDPTRDEVEQALLVVGDRVCRAVADPAIRNAQETRQLDVLGEFLNEHEYRRLNAGEASNAFAMPGGTYSFRMNVPVRDSKGQSINMPIDAVVMPRSGNPGPLLIEAKSAGDFTNVNKRRKEEATKMRQLRSTYGDEVRFILFLCGYFDRNYLGYEAASGIDWVWEHRPDDVLQFGL